jgi:hypothetical protein
LFNRSTITIHFDQLPYTMRIDVLPVLLALSLALSLAGCKQAKEADAEPVHVIELVAAPPKSAAPSRQLAAPASFDVASVPVTRTAQPPFPFLDLPEAIKPNGGTSHRQDVDRVLVVAGKELITVEGRVERRHFPLARARLSQDLAERNYHAALKEMGGVQVNKVQPSDPDFLAAHGGNKLKSSKESEKLGLLNLDAHYSSYLIRKPDANIWIIVSIDEQNVNTVAIEDRKSVAAMAPQDSRGVSN